MFYANNDICVSYCLFHKTLLMYSVGIEVCFSFTADLKKIEGAMDCTVRNANHEKVLAVIEKFLKERYQDVCSCPRCVNDIAAIALNYLPPHYYVEDGGNKDLGSPMVMVETAVVEAIGLIMDKPNHP